MRPLRRADLKSDPVEQFETWYKKAERSACFVHPNAVCLSTIRPDGSPEGRIVLLKEYGSDGFAFFTNSLSMKGVSLKTHPRAAMTFYWDALELQVRILGKVKPASRSRTEDYFALRPRASQIGAWASLQSQVMQSEDELKQRVKFFTEKFKDQDVPCPLQWKGYILSPEQFEFWQAQTARLHIRYQYRKEKGKWRIRRLYP